MQADGTRSRRFVTLVGEIDVQRSVFRCSKRKNRIYPLNEYLQTDTTCFTQSVQKIVSKTASLESFERSSNWLEMSTGLYISPRSVERISEMNGRVVQELLIERSTSALSQLSPCEEVHSIPTLYV